MRPEYYSSVMRDDKIDIDLRNFISHAYLLFYFTIAR